MFVIMQSLADLSAQMPTVPKEKLPQVSESVEGRSSYPNNCFILLYISIVLLFISDNSSFRLEPEEGEEVSSRPTKTKQRTAVMV